jgi:hypothetical protein
VVRPEHTAHLASLVEPGVPSGGSAAGAGGSLPADLEVVERSGHVLWGEREEEGGHRVGAGLGVALHPLGRQLVEIRAHRDADLLAAASDLRQLLVELGQA